MRKSSKRENLRGEKEETYIYTYIYRQIDRERETDKKAREHIYIFFSLLWLNKGLSGNGVLIVAWAVLPWDDMSQALLAVEHVAPADMLANLQGGGHYMHLVVLGGQPEYLPPQHQAIARVARANHKPRSGRIACQHTSLERCINGSH